MKKTHSTNLLSKIGLIVGSIVLILVVTETALSLYKYYKYDSVKRKINIEKRSKYLIWDPDDRRGFVTHKDYNEMHPLFGYVLKQFSDEINNFGFSTDYNVKLNDDGYYLEGIDQKNKLVVGIFGGSVASNIAGYHEYFENKIKSIFPDKNPVIIDFAIPGHALPQSFNIFVYFRDLIDVAIFVDGLNEPWNYINNNNMGYPPEFAKAGIFKFKLSLQELTTEQFKSTWRMVSLRKRLAQITELSLLPVIKHSALVHSLWVRVGLYLRKKINRESLNLVSSYREIAEPFFNVSDEKIVRFSAKQWYGYHRLVHHIALLKDIIDIHIIQPSLYIPDSKLKLTDIEKKYLDVEQTKSKFAVLNGYPLLRNELLTLVNEGVTGIDFSYIFKDEDRQIYIDYAHYNEYGNKMIIDKIIPLLVEKIKDKDGV